MTITTFRAACATLFLLLAAACSDKAARLANTEMSSRPAPGISAQRGGVAPGFAAMSAPAPQVPRTSESLAYEHTVSVELGKQDLPKRIAEVQTACASSKEFGCTLLDVSSESHEGVPAGSIRMRLAPAGVEPIIEIAAKGGEVTGRNTHAEDLAQPVADTERELALMTTHRDRLAEFMKSKDLKVDQLITVSRELATVQSQIDSLSTQRANLRRRIDTEVLTINLTLPRKASEAEQHPVRDAFGVFGSQLWQALGEVILFLANLIPWLLVIIPGLFVLRLFWRWMSRWIARREARGQA